jgi:hypothetical protein
MSEMPEGRRNCLEQRNENTEVSEVWGRNGKSLYSPEPSQPTNEGEFIVEIILDFGSGNTCKNDPKIVKKMIDELAKVDKKRQCIIKWQLFEKAGDNIPLTHASFEYAYKYAQRKGFKTTASVFDEKSLDFLLNRDLRLFNQGATPTLFPGGIFYQPDPGEEPIRFKVPFVKIANRRDLYWLIEKIPRTMPVYVSYDNVVYLPKCLGELDKKLYCISKYPAQVEDYVNAKGDGISDHTVGLKIIKKWDLQLLEKHFKLPDSTGLDAGPFAITPDELREVLKLL